MTLVLIYVLGWIFGSWVTWRIFGLGERYHPLCFSCRGVDHRHDCVGCEARR